ncbi:MAG: D-alanine--D-alanine ligase [Prevotellaceae bacterium]|jgi:D-alanine-D-alanine ligase|nr:D-alanine--D-alanine ligase [Prevotellaceae bacterium]
MKKNIAIVAGGDSSEWTVSLKSAAGLESFINRQLYNTYLVTIIGQTWQVELANNIKIPIDKSDFTCVLNGEKIRFDLAYIIIHGTPGENGILQGYFQLIGMPFSCCDVLPSALTFNKFVCNHYLQSFGITVAPSLLLRRGETLSDSNIAQIGLPCFVKPNVGGSSFGVTKVKQFADLQAALDKAFAESDEVIIEALLEGTEVTCGMYRTRHKTVVFPITEVVTANEFFDFDAKYNGQSQEITPARIESTIAANIASTTQRIYRLINARGIIRVDYIICNGLIQLLEVNTVPGMTPASFIPQQIRAAGLNIGDVLTDIIEDAIETHVSPNSK